MTEILLEMWYITPLLLKEIYYSIYTTEINLYELYIDITLYTLYTILFYAKYIFSVY